MTELKELTKRHPLITRGETVRNHMQIGSIELKLEVARREGYKIRKSQTRYHKVVDGVVVTVVDESKPTYYFYDDGGGGNSPLPLLDAYQIAMEYYLANKESK